MEMPLGAIQSEVGLLKSVEKGGVGYFTAPTSVGAVPLLVWR
jgi:hypothetical protein